MNLVLILLLLLHDSFVELIERRMKIHFFIRESIILVIYFRWVTKELVLITSNPKVEANGLSFADI